MNAPKDNNKDFKTYLFNYRHDGATWAFEIKATSAQDATYRVSEMARAQYRGEVGAAFPGELAPYMGPLEWARSALASLFRRGR